MSESGPSPASPSQLLQKYTNFPTSHPFKILTPLPHAESDSLPPPKTIYILDSSFNPPTTAHLRLARSALLQDSTTTNPKRLVLLLATQNADKEPKPASFPHRLAMMELFALDLLANVQSQQKKEIQDRRRDTEQELDSESAIGIGIAVTKFPYFIDKASAIEESENYPPTSTQVHLTGFDTLIRILNPKYYPPKHDLSPLEPFMEKHRLRVAYRTGGGWGEGKEQEEYLAALERGEREGEGGRRAWARRIELVEGRKEREEVVSSTAVRDAVKFGEWDVVGRLVTTRVKEWIEKENLYQEA